MLLCEIYRTKQQFDYRVVLCCVALCTQTVKKKNWPSSRVAQVQYWLSLYDCVCMRVTGFDGFVFPSCGVSDSETKHSSSSWSNVKPDFTSLFNNALSFSSSLISCSCYLR